MRHGKVAQDTFPENMSGDKLTQIRIQMVPVLYVEQFILTVGVGTVTIPKKMYGEQAFS